MIKWVVKSEPFSKKSKLRIIAEIRNICNITKPQLVSILNLGKTTIDNGIRVLRKNGYIERIGSNKTGYWKVVKD